ncbi:MAG: PKD domain-containing protein, partial [Brachybacterium sp.]|nr:PKD domain-containing protein [Brachybacterium sp.]
FSGCGASLDGGSWSCTPHPDSCEAGSGSTVTGDGDVLEIGNVSSTPVEGVTQRGTRVDNESGETDDLGVRCALPGTPEYADAPPVVITVTREDFARLPVEPLQPHAGPPEGWLPVNMVNVLYTDPSTQLLNTELLDTPVAIRATPVSYHWDLGDGNTITTTNPGKPFPSEAVSSAYTQEGWYDITLTTTFSGQFSVAGGEWQDIDGTIEVTSDPVPVFSKSLESRLVNGEVPVDEDDDPWIPERTSDTEGPLDPDARHREI